MQAHILFISPALFIITAEFWCMLADYKNNHKSTWFLNLLLTLFIILPIRYAIERIKPFTKSDRNPQWVTDLKKLNNKKINKGVLFNYDKPIEAMFYMNLTVYSYIPDKKVITDLIEKGYTVMINNSNSIPDDIKTIKGVMINN